MAKATLIKRESEDGLIGVNDDVPVGRRYVVDLDTVRTVGMFNVERQQPHEKQIVRDAEGGWLPTELLLIEESDDVADA
jgi:hypothetical protein